MEDEGISTARALRLHNELHVISITFLYWDHLMTFGDEVRYLWRKAKTRSTYYFFLTRYLACFGDIAITVFQFTVVPISWSDILTTALPYTALTRIYVKVSALCVLLTLRIYALYGLEKRIYIGLLAFGAVLLAVSCWALIGKSGVPQPDVIGCHIATSRKLGVYLAVPWEALFIYDVVIFIALFYKSFQKRRESQMLRHNPILTLLIRDGAIYFAIMALMNVANVLTYYITGPLLRGCLSTMASCMSVTLTSRLMLNLHSVDRTGIFSTTSQLDTSTYEYGSDIQLDTLRTRDLERSAHAPARISVEPELSR